MYNQKVIDTFSNPKNVGELPDANGIGMGGSAECGDIMKIYLKIENDVIVDCKFQTFGCAAANAADVKPDFFTRLTDSFTAADIGILSQKNI